mgnify:CR=1 FL=1
MVTGSETHGLRGSAVVAAAAVLSGGVCEGRGGGGDAHDARPRGEEAHACEPGGGRAAWLCAEGAGAAAACAVLTIAQRRRAQRPLGAPAKGGGGWGQAVPQDPRPRPRSTHKRCPVSCLLQLAAERALTHAGHRATSPSGACDEQSVVTHDAFSAAGGQALASNTDQFPPGWKYRHVDPLFLPRWPCSHPACRAAAGWGAASPASCCAGLLGP